MIGLGLASPAALTWACLVLGAASSIFWTLALCGAAAGAAWPFIGRRQGRSRTLLRVGAGICMLGPAFVLCLLPLVARG